MLHPKVKFQLNVILFLLSAFVITYTSFSAAKDKYFQIWHTDGDGKSELTHKGKVTTTPHENTISTQLSFESDPAVTASSVICTPSDGDTTNLNHADVTFAENQIPNVLLLDDFLSTSPDAGQIISQLESNPVILVNMPSVILGHLQTPLEPVFQVTRVSNEDGQITINAQPLNCRDCNCQRCPGSDGKYCADCSCCTGSGCPSEGDKCSGCGCDACAPKEGASNAGDCANCPCCQNQCQGSKRSAIIIKLSSGNGSIASIHLRSPSGTVTVLLSENTFSDTATAPDNVAAVAALLATMAINAAVTKSAK